MFAIKLQALEFKCILSLQLIDDRHYELEKSTENNEVNNFILN